MGKPVCQIKTSWTAPIVFILLLSFIAALFVSIRPVQADSSIKNILIINSYNDGFTWTREQMEGIMKSLRSAPYTTSIFVEYLDWKNFPYEEHMRHMHDIMKYKYAGKKIDLLITTDDAALEFSLRYRKDLFGEDIPTIFSGVFREQALEMTKGKRNVTGCIESIHPAETLKTALKIYPDAKKVYVVHDNTDSGIDSLADVRYALKSMGWSIPVESFGNLRIDRMEEGFPADYADAIIYVTSYSRDEEGYTIQIEKFSEILSEKLDRPVFHAFEMAMGSGILGGCLLSGKLHGEQVGNRALAVLSGAKPGDFPLSHEMYALNEYDYKVMQRFGISMKEIPADSIVVNKPFSFFETYRTLVLAVLFAFLMLSALLLTLLFNIRKRKRAEQALLSSNEEILAQFRELEANREIIRNNELRYRLVFEISNDGLWEYNLITRERYFTDRLYDLFSFRQDGMHNTLEEWFDILHPEDLERIRIAFRKLLDGDVDMFTEEYRIANSADGYRWIQGKARSVKDETGKVLRLVGAHSDIHLKKLQEEQIRRLAYFDSLTGLANRAQMMETFDRVKTEGMPSASLIFMDLDNFKLVNDSLGHGYGDKLLVEVSRRLRYLLDEKFQIARLGGDEFVMFLGGLADQAVVSGYLEKLSAAINGIIELNGMNLVLSASFGVAKYPEDGQDFDELLRNADIAMYRAKALGKRNYVFFENYMQDNIVNKLHMQNHLRKAIENMEFRLAYQPQLELKNKSVIGFEALIRWESPTLGRVMPNSFISLAEETGMIIPIGQWVLEQACRFMKKLHGEGYPGLILSVNVSVIQLLEPNFTDMVLELLRDSGLEARYLNIEITESILMEQTESNINKIRVLREQGINVSLDDFGKGYSSLTYLKQLPINYLKIDKEFIRELLDKSESRSITGTIISLAHELGIGVVAEGVESEAQYRFLAENDCDFLQGYLISKPITGEEIPGFFQSRKEQKD